MAKKHLWRSGRRLFAVLCLIGIGSFAAADNYADWKFALSDNR